ncbi:MAG TPA: radical SAM protein, partial [Rubellimicrobium sp.]|nr:radical SAM protein [Rubellimicrobium sp.]
MLDDTSSQPSGRPPRLWRPRRVLVTRSALEWEHGRSIAERAGALGLTVVELPSDRLALDLPSDPRRAYAEAKATLAVVVAPPSKRRLQPIAPSADWRVDLAEGCPAHCTYCYLAGSLKGPPVTRAYANLPEILDELPRHLGQGTVTSRQAARAGEGTTFEASCYTDPLAIEHL